jgi:RNA polymerase sigma-70 factor, ECF subfamily
VTKVVGAKCVPSGGMGDTPTDADVIARVLNGDTEAFGLLVDRYQNEFAGYAKYMTGSIEETADIIQESLVRAFRSLRRCQDRANFKGWLFRIVSNQCKTHLKRRRRRSTEPLSEDHPAPQDPGSEAEAADVRRRVHQALQELPTDQREALVLKYVEGMSLPEMTGLLKASASALKMRLMRGRQALREKLEGVAL